VPLFGDIAVDGHGSGRIRRCCGASKGTSAVLRSASARGGEGTPESPATGWAHATVTSWSAARRSRDAERKVPANRHVSEVRDLLGAVQEVCAAEVDDLQGLPTGLVVVPMPRIAAGYRRFWGFQALGNPSA
jgi:hypothetical protein